jgi:hypothetical protein
MFNNVQQLVDPLTLHLNRNFAFNTCCCEGKLANSNLSFRVILMFPPCFGYCSYTIIQRLIEELHEFVFAGTKGSRKALACLSVNFLPKLFIHPRWICCFPVHLYHQAQLLECAQAET